MVSIHAPVWGANASLLSITKTTKEEMSEYLNDIEVFYYAKGVVLPVPSDLSWVKL